MLAHLARPAIFAHRGASAHAPENTISAFKLAIEQHADAIEMDAKLTLDGEVVIIHDQTLERTTNGVGKVSDKTLIELRHIEAGSHFSNQFMGESIPALYEVFDTLGDSTNYNIELTNYTSLTDKLPERVADLILMRGLMEKVLISSFNPIALLRFHRRLPKVPIALLARPGKPGKLARSPLGYFLKYSALHVYFDDLEPRLLANIHQLRSRIHVYTVNSEDDIRSAIIQGVDGIFTDDPLLARHVLLGRR